MKRIKLASRPVYTIIDDEDWGRVSRHSWYGRPTKKGYFIPTAQIKNKKIVLARFLLEAPKGIHVDHINGDPLDNRRSNLRLATHQQNCFNRRKRNKNRFKGIWTDPNQPNVRKPWRSEIYFNQKKYHLGMFKTDVEAAQAYDKAAQEFFGEFAKLNFPSSV